MMGSVAEGKVRLAMMRLAATHPFHAGILAQWRIEGDASTHAMGVGFREGKMRLVYSPEFVERITMSELEGVLHHEVNHVLFGHVQRVPEPGENRTARTVAQEVTVNEWVPEPLPDNPLRLSDFPFLPEDEDTDTRYERLRGRLKDDEKPAEDPAEKGGVGGEGDGDAPAGDKGKPSPGSKKGRGAGSEGKEGSQAGGKSRQGTSGRGKGAGRGETGMEPVDDHGTWQEIQNNAEEAAAAIDMDLGLAWGSLGREQKETVPESLRAGLESALDGLGMGGCGSGVEEETISGGKASVTWQQLLQQHVTRIMAPSPVFNRAPRRFPDLLGIVPGRARRPVHPHVMAVIDTSGSMGAEMLADISAELGVMSRHFAVTVVECDTVIHAAYRYRPIRTVRGRGGTDLRPPFEPAFLRKHNPGVIVYFTDGDGVAPPAPPPVPVIWAITSGSRAPAPWGRKITMNAFM